MCGRAKLASPGSALERLLGMEAEAAGDEPPRFNIAPGQRVLAVRGRADGVELFHPTWGVALRGDGPLLVNARLETAAIRPSLGAALAQRRAVLLVDGFYEWRRLARRATSPHLFEFPAAAPFGLAALWDPSANSGPRLIVATVAAAAWMSPYHDRQPLLLDRAAIGRWLAPGPPPRPGDLEALPPPNVRPVGPAVNDVRRDGPECLEPPPPDPQRGLFG